VKVTSTVLIVAAALVLGVGVGVGVGATQLGSGARQAASARTSAPARPAPVSSRAAPVTSAPVSPGAGGTSAKAAACRRDALSDRDSDNLKAALTDDGCGGVLSDETIREIEARAASHSVRSLWESLGLPERYGSSKQPESRSRHG
jgi:hypothetical protein